MRDPDHNYCLHLEQVSRDKIKELEQQLAELRGVFERWVSSGDPVAISYGLQAKMVLQGSSDG